MISNWRDLLDKLKKDLVLFEKNKPDIEILETCLDELNSIQNLMNIEIPDHKDGKISKHKLYFINTFVSLRTKIFDLMKEDEWREIVGCIKKPEQPFLFI